MNNELRCKINELASAILHCYEIKSPITNIVEEVEKLGGKIKVDSSLGIFSDGRIEKENNSFSISIPINQTSERKNFTIAHELGHLFLHMGYKINDDLWEKSDNKVFNRKGNSEIEIQANEFAAAFLMPKEKYKEIMDENTVGNTVYIAKVAKYFNVSIDAASYRGKWLGYLQW
ncbi:MAG: ImmA/IrrE family metallo-endopeptidase [Catonella sp.]|uniref:ImmA/IrrE family metallo-endopeptidase n=1 Tax=Catonella sp. TaxID=2382125 RepID=UPI003F9EC15C